MTGFTARLLGEVSRRTHPSQDADWARLFGLQSASTYAGVTVTEEGALALPAVYACVRVLSETVASLPLIVYQRQTRGKTRAENHPLYRILHTQPNPEQTAMEFREMMTASLCLWGNAYAEIVRNGSGQTAELWPLRPDRMAVRRVRGQVEYEYAPGDGSTVKLRREQVHHVRTLSGDGLVGYSPVRTAMQAVGLALATEEYGARFFGNGARPGIVLQHPGALSDKAYDRLRGSWQEEHGGLSQAHRIRILEEGMTVETLSVPPEEAQFLQTRQFQAEEIARIYRMPPHKIGLLNNATFSNIEHQAIEFVTDTVRPWLVRFEQAIQRDLLTANEQKRFYAEHLVEGLLRGDTMSRYQAYAVARQWGWMSANDIRRLENMDEIEGGDEYLTPMNMTAAGEEPANEEQ